MSNYSLVGYDGSATSQRALRFAVQLAQATGGRVRVVSVLQVTEGSADTCTLMIADQGGKRCSQLLDEVKDLVPGTASLIDAEVVRGSPGDVLLEQVRNHAIMLLEATNLLQMPGRHVAKSGEKSENPDVELGPDQIETLINKDRASWINYAHGLHDATMKAFAAIEKKDTEGLLDAGDGIDNACEKCHLQYWYPNERKPESAPSVRKGGS